MNHVTKFIMPDGTEISSKISSNVEQLSGSNAVVIGDSWCDPDIENSAYGELPKKVFTEALGMQVYNYAQAGWGFAVDGKLFITEVENANNAMTDEQKRDTAIVFIFGGLNDVLHRVESSSVEANFNTLISRVCEIFTNARVCVFPFQWGYGWILGDPANPADTDIYGYDMTWRSYVSQLVYKFKGAAAGKPVQVFDNVATWTLCQYGDFLNDTHLNQLGYDRLAGEVLTCILGGSVSKTMGGYQTFTADGLDQAVMQYYYKDGITYWWFQAKLTAAASSTSYTLTASPHPWLRVSQPLLFPAIDSHHYGSGTGYVWFNQDATIKLEIDSLDSGYWIFSNGSFPATGYKATTH